MLVVLAIEGLPPIDVAVGLTIALDVNAADDFVVIALLELVLVVLTVDVVFVTKCDDCKGATDVGGGGQLPTVIPSDVPTADDEVDDEMEVVNGTIEMVPPGDDSNTPVGNTVPCGLPGGD